MNNLLVSLITLFLLLPPPAFNVREVVRPFLPQPAHYISVISVHDGTPVKIEKDNRYDSAVFRYIDTSRVFAELNAKPELKSRYYSDSNNVLYVYKGLSAQSKDSVTSFICYRSGLFLSASLFIDPAFRYSVSSLDFLEDAEYGYQMEKIVLKFQTGKCGRKVGLHLFDTNKKKSLLHILVEE
jgi:hypothetical protein